MNICVPPVAVTHKWANWRYWLDIELARIFDAWIEWYNNEINIRSYWKYINLGDERPETLHITLTSASTLRMSPINGKSQIECAPWLNSRDATVIRLIHKTEENLLFRRIFILRLCDVCDEWGEQFYYLLSSWWDIIIKYAMFLGWWRAPAKRKWFIGTKTIMFTR